MALLQWISNYVGPKSVSHLISKTKNFFQKKKAKTKKKNTQIQTTAMLKSHPDDYFAST